eukprot:XP_001689436.1 predicted protein [Chlamydomonas reinhardtii]
MAEFGGMECMARVYKLCVLPYGGGVFLDNVLFFAYRSTRKMPWRVWVPSVLSLLKLNARCEMV